MKNPLYKDTNCLMAQTNINYNNTQAAEGREIAQILVQTQAQTTHNQMKSRRNKYCDKSTMFKTKHNNKFVHSINIMCIDIWERIMTFCYITDQLSIMQTCRALNYNPNIYNLDVFHEVSSNSDEIENRITDKVFKQRKYRQLRSLKLEHNVYIKNFGHLTSLEKLIIPKNRVVTNNVLSKLINLKTLDIKYCKKVTNINQLKNLEEVTIGYDITDSGIAEINPKKIVIQKNGKIKNLNHMTNLESIVLINCFRLENVKDSGTWIDDFRNMTNLKHLALHYIHIGDINLENPGLESLELIHCTGNIPNLNTLTNLKKLIIREGILSNDMIQNLENIEHLEILNCTGSVPSLQKSFNLKKVIIRGTLLSNEVINDLKNVEHLEILNNNRRIISDLNALINLRKLIISHSDLPNEAIQNLTKIEHLELYSCNATSNHNAIPDLNNMLDLKKLIVHKMNIPNEAVKNLTKIEYLKLSECQIVPDLNNMLNLRELIVYEMTIPDEAIEHLTNVEHLELCHCKIVPNLNNMLNLRELIVRHMTMSDKAIESLTNIEHLELHYFGTAPNLDNMINLKKLIAPFMTFPDGTIRKLTNIKRLKIKGHNYNCK